MSSILEILRNRLFDKDNHSLDVIEEIEKQCIELLDKSHLDYSERQEVKFLRKDARKKYLYWRFPPERHASVSKRTADYLQNRFDDKEKEKEKENQGLL